KSAPCTRSMPRQTFRRNSRKTPSSTPLKPTKSKILARTRSQRRKRRCPAPWTGKKHSDIESIERSGLPNNIASLLGTTLYQQPDLMPVMEFVLVDLFRNNRHFFGGDSFPDWPRTSPASLIDKSRSWRGS